LLGTTEEDDSPIGHGWSLKDDGSLQVVWSDMPPAPESIIELATHCKRAKCLGNCQCKLLSIEFTEMRKCRGNCSNIDFEDDIQPESDDDY